MSPTPQPGQPGPLGAMLFRGPARAARAPEASARAAEAGPGRRVDRAATVLHVITGLDTGGAETMLYRLVTRMQGGAFRPVVISLIDGGAVRDRIVEAGVPVTSLRMREATPSVPAAMRLIRAVREVRPDVIQGWMYHGNLAASTAALLGGVRAPVVWNVRASLAAWESHSAMTRGLIRIGAGASRLPAAVIYNAQRSAGEHEAMGYSPARRVVIPNGFDCDVLRPDPAGRAAVRAEIGLATSTPLVGMIARFDPAKDHGNFLEAAARLLTRVPEVHFLLAGRGVTSENREIAGHLARLGIGPHVHLLGERADITELNCALDVAALSSRSEGFPNTLGEAMACGVPCATTDVGDAASLVGDTGMVVPPRDPAALSAAWASLLELGEEGRRALGDQARERIVQHYSIEAVARQYESLYARLLDDREER